MLGYLLRRSNLHDPIRRKNSATRRKIFGFELARMVCDLPRKSILALKIQGYQKIRMLVLTLGTLSRKMVAHTKNLKNKKRSYNVDRYDALSRIIITTTP